MRVHVVWWLASTLTLGGCIETDRPILVRTTSEAPQSLAGVWGPGLLVESLDQYTLRLTLPPTEKGEIVFRGPAHTARLANGFYVIQHPLGIELVRQDGPDRLFSAGIAPGVTRAQIDALARSHDTKIDLKTHPEAKDGMNLTMERIGSTGAKRLIALLNDMIARKILVSFGEPALRNTDGAALENLRKAVARYDQKRAADFSAAVAKLGGNDAARREGCDGIFPLYMGGHVEAIAQWGRCHLYGLGDGRKDPKRGFNALHQADAFGSVTASYEIGKAYAEGSGGQTRDERVARVFLESAATNGSQEARALLAKMDAPPAAQAPTPAGSEPMWYAVTIGPKKLDITAVRAVVCTKDGFEADTRANVFVSLSDIVKAGKELDVDTLDAVFMLAQMTGGDAELREELANFDFRKVDSGRISKIFEDEWKPMARKYTSAGLGKFDQDVQADLLNTISKVEQRYEASTGVTIDLEFTGGGMSETTTSRCRAAGPR